MRETAQNKGEYSFHRKNKGFKDVDAAFRQGLY